MSLEVYSETVYSKEEQNSTWVSFLMIYTNAFFVENVLLELRAIHSFPCGVSWTAERVQNSVDYVLLN